MPLSRREFMSTTASVGCLTGLAALGASPAAAEQPIVQHHEKEKISPAVHPPFTYGEQYPMTPGNAAPGLAVWLFLVTNPDYLDVLDKVEGSDPSLIPVKKIAEATNLTVEGVQSILDIYSKDNVNYDAFRQVASSFQVYARNSGYDDTHCPGGPMAILELAKRGVSVDPAATEVSVA